MGGRRAAWGLAIILTGCTPNPSPVPIVPITPSVPRSSPTPTPAPVLNADGVPDPRALAIDSQGNLYLANGASGSSAIAGLIVKYDATLTPQATADMGKDVGAATLDASGSLWVATLLQLKQLDSSLAAGSNFKSIASGSVPVLPTAIAVDPSHHVWIADAANGVVARYTNLNLDFTLSVPGSSASGQAYPAGLAVSSDSIWITSRGDTRIFRRRLTDGGDAGTFLLPAPARGPIVLAPNNLLWASHEFVQGTRTLAKFNLAGELKQDYDVAQDVPVALAADSRGFMWAALRDTSRVVRLTPADGSSISYQNQWIVRPQALAFDAQGNAYVASPGATGSIAKILAAP